jgi:hypothetical protein
MSERRHGRSDPPLGRLHRPRLAGGRRGRGAWGGLSAVFSEAQPPEQSPASTSSEAIAPPSGCLTGRYSAIDQFTESRGLAWTAASVVGGAGSGSWRSRYAVAASGTRSAARFPRSPWPRRCSGRCSSCSGAGEAPGDEIRVGGLGKARPRQSVGSRTAHPAGGSTTSLPWPPSTTPLPAMTREGCGRGKSSRTSSMLSATTRRSPPSSASLA